MDRKQMLFVVMSIVLVFVAVAATTARPGTSPATPLYTYRMEQASNDMNFLPAEGNGFTFTTKGGHAVNYDIVVYHDYDELLSTGCKPSCISTCYSTCVSTCNSTCVSTCPQTCVSTCSSTCLNTCPNTCVNTCSQTCVSTCSYTCVSTCYGTCAETCDLSCIFDP
jgi:hypothetical protein